MTLAENEHQEMNGQVEVTWRTLRKIAYLLIVHVRVLEAYIGFTLMHTADDILPIIAIKYPIKKYDKPVTPLKSKQVRNLSYHLFVFYFVHVLYIQLLQMLGQWR